MERCGKWDTNPTHLAYTQFSTYVAGSQLTSNIERDSIEFPVE